MNETKIRNGVFLPKSILITPYQNQFLTQRQRLLQTQLGGNQNRGNAPTAVDWSFLFNLGVFVLFICSLFYICLHRYRNKEQLKREKEHKQKMLVLEFKQLLEEQQKKQDEIKKQQKYNFIDNRQMMNNQLQLKFENPYLLNY